MPAAAVLLTACLWVQKAAAIPLEWTGGSLPVEMISRRIVCSCLDAFCVS